MRGFDRDLIRGGHYGQRSCEPHLKAEHMAAPTNAANVKKALANSEPSTHGTRAQTLATTISRKHTILYGFNGRRRTAADGHLAEGVSAKPTTSMIVYQGLGNGPQSVSTNRYANRL